MPDGLTAGERALYRRWAEREARAFAQVRHRNVIRTRAVLPPWIVMEYVPSWSLREIIGAGGPLPPDRAAAVGLAVLAGLRAIHRAGLLHLDVKPGNVLVAHDGRVVLTDSAPAVTAAGVRALAEAGIVLGSPHYLAPERLDGGVAGVAADLWSLGATLYHAVEGRPPYPRPTTAATLRALAAGPPEPPRSAGPLGPVLGGLLRHDPAERPSVDRVAAALRGVARPRAGWLRAVGGSRAGGPVAGTSGGWGRAVVAAVLAGVLVTGVGGSRAREPAAPAGFVWFEQSRFRVALPVGWARRADGGDGLVADGPAGGATLRVGVRPAAADPVAALVAAERGAGLAGYRRIRIEHLGGSREAVWEFTYADPVAGRMREGRRVITWGELSYTIELRTSRDGWAGNQRTFGTVVGSFRPGPGR